jgi:hypothetical protein
MGYFRYFQVTAQSKQSIIRRQFAQSGHPEFLFILGAKYRCVKKQASSDSFYECPWFLSGRPDRANFRQQGVVFLRAILKSHKMAKLMCKTEHN